MTHTGPVPESSGTFTAEEISTRRCYDKCKLMTEHKIQTWESNCGGYEDYKFKCTVCGNVFWVDGDDG